MAALVTGLLAGPAVQPAQAAASSAGMFRAVGPSRLLDTRTHNGGSRVPAHGTLHLLVLGRGGVPTAQVSAVMLSVVVTQPVATGYISAYADGAARPVTSNVNFRPGVTVSDQVTARVGADGRVSLYNASAGTVELVADVYGYLTTTTGTPATAVSSTTPGAFVATTPTRLVDTRSSPGAGSPGAHATIDVTVAGHAGVPTSGVAAVAVTVTAAGPRGAGSVSAYPAGGTVPPQPSLHFDTGVTTAGAALVPPGAGGAITLVNDSAATTPLVVDVVGYVVAGGAGPAGLYVPVPPADVTLSGGNLVAARHAVGLETSSLIPEVSVSALVVSVTASATAAGYVTAGTTPATSALTLRAGSSTSGLLVLPTGSGSSLFNGSSATADIRVALVGYFVAAPVGAVSGRVTDAATGDGLSGVVVHLFDPDPGKADEYGEIFGTAVTGSDGRYTVPGVAPGTYMQCVFPANATNAPPHTSYDQRCWKDQPIFPFNDPTPVPVAAGRTATGIDASLIPHAAGSVSGRVTGAGGVPLAGIRVAVSDVVGTTDGDGTYRLDGIPPGSRTVAFTPGHLRTAGAPFGYLPAQVDGVTVTAGADHGGTDVRLDAQSRIVGHVRLPTGGYPDHSYVKLFGADGTTYFGNVDPLDGSYVVSGFSGGTFTVCFYVTDAPATSTAPYGWADECLKNVRWPVWGTPPSGTEPVSVGAGQERSVDATVEAAGAISGTVRAPDGTVLPQAQIDVYDPVTTTLLREVETDATGHYAVINSLVPSSTGYIVCAGGGFNPGRAAACYRDVPWSGSPAALPDGTTPVTVPSGAVHAGIDFTLAASPTTSRARRTGRHPARR